MKCKIFLLILSLLMMSVPKAFADYALCLHLADGTTQTFLIDTKPALSINNGVLTITTQDVEFSCNLGEVEHYDFPSNGHDRTNDITYDGGIRMVNNQILISGLTQSEDIIIYSLDGKMVSIDKCDASGNAEVSVSSLIPGIYIVKAGKNSIKIVKK